MNGTEEDCVTTKHIKWEKNMKSVGNIDLGNFLQWFAHFFLVPLLVWYFFGDKIERD